MNRVLVLDGAMGTWRVQTGLDAGAVHRAYAAAGADILCTDTLTGSRLEARGARGPGDEEARLAVLVARDAAEQTARLARERAPRVAAVVPFDLSGLDGLIAGGADLLLAETLASTKRIDTVLSALLRRRGMAPLMLSVAVSPAGLLPSGETLDEALRAAAGAPLYSFGVNCGSGIDGLRAALETIAARVTCRVSCHPAAGLADAFGRYDEPPAVTAAFLRDAAARGLVDIVGGCCGTTPAHIAAIARAVAGLPARMSGFRE